jgi:hypothetical protein
MTELTFSVDEEVMEVLNAMAEVQGISIEQILRNLLTGSIEDLRARASDPIIGFIENGEPDLAARDEEIMVGNCDPD